MMNHNDDPTAHHTYPPHPRPSGCRGRPPGGRRRTAADLIGAVGPAFATETNGDCLSHSTRRGYTPHLEWEGPSGPPRIL